MPDKSERVNILCCEVLFDLFNPGQKERDNIANEKNHTLKNLEKITQIFIKKTSLRMSLKFDDYVAIIAN